MASLLLPLNQSRTFFQAQKVKSNDIKQMLDSINKKVFTLGHQVLMVHIESEIRHFWLPSYLQANRKLSSSSWTLAGGWLGTETLTGCTKQPMLPQLAPQWLAKDRHEHFWKARMLVSGVLASVLTKGIYCVGKRWHRLGSQELTCSRVSIPPLSLWLWPVCSKISTAGHPRGQEQSHWRKKQFKSYWW